MTCSGNDSDAGLNFTSWCDPCTIYTGKHSEHFVRVENMKSIQRTVTVRGLINSHSNRAKFVGGLAKSDLEWEETDLLLANMRQSAPVYVRVFGGTTVEKCSPRTGPEYISIKVEYQNLWPTPSPWKTASTSKADFTIQVS